MTGEVRIMLQSIKWVLVSLSLASTFTAEPWKWSSYVPLKKDEWVKIDTVTPNLVTFRSTREVNGVVGSGIWWRAHLVLVKGPLHERSELVLAINAVDEKKVCFKYPSTISVFYGGVTVFERSTVIRGKGVWYKLIPHTKQILPGFWFLKKQQTLDTWIRLFKEQEVDDHKADYSDEPDVVGRTCAVIATEAVNRYARYKAAGQIDM